MRKILSMLMAVVMLICLVPVQIMAEDANEAVVLDSESANGLELSDEIAPEGVGAGKVTYPLTLKVYNPDNGSFTEKTFNSENDLLGFGINHGGRNDWTYRTFRKLFFGWSIDSKFKNSTPSQSMKPDDKIYRDIEPISAIEGLKNDSVLYPITMPVTDLMAFFKMLETGGGTLYINGEKTVKDVEDEATEKDNFIKRTEGFDDKDAEKRLIEYYFDPEKEEYEIQAISEFYFKDPRVPFVIVENPLGIIKSAKGVTDFTGENPQNYSYEDLIVELDNKFDVAKKQEEWTFESSTFIVSDVLDENYNSLSPTISLPNPDSLVTTFSFENPNGLKKFIIRTTPRSDNSDAEYGKTPNYPTDNTTVVTGRQILQPMKLKTGKSSNIKISKEYAKELEADKALESISKGVIKGAVGIDKTRMTGKAALLALFLPNSQAIPKLDSKNTMNFDFAIPYVRFDKNTKAYGDTKEQNLGYSKFVVNKAMVSDAFDKNTQPNTDITKAGEAFISDEDYKVDETKLTFNGTECTFKGWNTKADGSGKFFTKDTVIKYEDLYQRENDNVEEDITLYAVWYPPAPTPKPSTTVILTLDENHAHGKITDYDVMKGEAIDPYLYTPHRRGYIFRGWSYNRDFLDEVRKGDIVYTDTVLYAIWKKDKAKDEVAEPEEIKGQEHKAYIFGYPDGTVRPDGKITRAEAAAMLARLLEIESIGSADKPMFPDTPSAWYNKAINAVVQRGIMKGYPDGTFKPNDAITRAEFTQMISTIDNKPYGTAPFADVVGHWAERPIGSEYQAGRILGYPDGTFRPDAHITRCEAAVILNKIFERNFDNMSLLKCKNPQMIKYFIDLDASFWGYNDMVEATNTHEYVRRVTNRVEENWLLIKDIKDVK